MITEQQRAAKNAYTRAWRLANPEKVSAWRERNRERRLAQKRERYARATPEQRTALTQARRLWSHALTSADLDALYAAQDGRCAICDLEAPKLTRAGLYIDHDHATGERRGLLCRDCNQALTAWEKNGPAWALRALTYLGDPPLRRLRKEGAA